MIALYHALSIAAAFLVGPGFWLYSTFTGKKRRGLSHHFGWTPLPHKKTGRTLWLHALSVGEVNAAAPVLREIRSRRPELKIVITVTTDGGYETARAKLPFADVVAFHPLDCWPFVQLALRRIRPDVFVLVDTGFWPGLLDALQQKNIPVILFNGRLSEKSLQQYQRWRCFWEPLFSRMTLACMQDVRGAEAMRALGTPSQNVQVQADTKVDQLTDVSSERRQILREQYSLGAFDLVFLAGSTHDGEEAIVLDAWQSLRERWPELKLILAPRRVERTGEVAALLRERGIEFGKRSRYQKKTTDVWLLDTLGELAELYAVADIAFVGRSLIAPGGGHSLIEPAWHGCPALHGPYIDNVRGQATELIQNGIAVEVKDAAHMAQVAEGLLADNTRRGVLGEKARILIQGQKGGSKTMAELILKFFPTG